MALLQLHFCLCLFVGNGARYNINTYQLKHVAQNKLNVFQIKKKDLKFFVSVSEGNNRRNHVCLKPKTERL